MGGMKNFFISASLFFVFTPVAKACLVLAPFSDFDKPKAQVVFEGKAVGYEIDKNNKDKAKVTFEVLKTIKGENRKRWMVVLEGNTNTRIPKDMTQFVRCYSTRSEVGLLKATKKNEVAPLVSSTCNPPYILPLDSKASAPVDCLQE